ncbi:DMT family transporter [uncultured Cardiobacterium sp.]|uniref:DMT family transporter n=1 Tax=uncultured Cardiobacterium sp. TaxID=417619 RepID=UPI002630540E|nr:DMT family transporter [uncultured Cardiobacterium sp.]
MSMRFWQANGLPHPYVMLFLAPLFWATSNVAGKLGKAWLTPYEFTFWRWVLAAALLSWLFRARIRGDLPVLRRRKWWLLVVGGSGFALFNIVLYSAYVRGASVVNVSIITALIPVMVLLVEVFFLRGRAHPLQWLGVALSFVGVVWVVSKGHPRALLNTGLAAGDVLALVTSAIYAGYSLALRRAPVVHWASLLWAMCVAAVVVSAPFFLWEGVAQGFRQPPWQAWLLLVYVAVFIAILSKLFYMESVIAIGAGRAALTMNLLPVFGALVGVAVFPEERLGGYVWVALLLVAAGIAASEWGAARLRARLPES